MQLKNFTHEPTNDLDMDTLDLLQEVLSEYEGTILIVSHDRDFLDKVTTSLLYIDGSGKIAEYVGTYTQLLSDLKDKKNRSTPMKKNDVSSKSIINKPLEKTVKKGLTFTERHLLEQLPELIHQQNEKVSVLQTQLINPDIYQNPDEVRHVSEKLQNEQKKLEELENKWLDLQIKSEEI